MPLRYCIKHEQHTQTSVDYAGNEYHFVRRPIVAFDIDACYGPFAECPPPELEENWQDHLIAPCWDEMVLFAEAAGNLQRDFFEDEFIERYKLNHF